MAKKGNDAEQQYIAERATGGCLTKRGFLVKESNQFFVHDAVGASAFREAVHIAVDGAMDCERGMPVEECAGQRK